MFRRFLAQAGIAVAIFVAFLAVRGLVTIWQGTTAVVRITSVDGDRVCVTPTEGAGQPIECLVAGAAPTANGLTGQEPAWYATRIGTCILVRGTSGTPGGTVEKETPCPAAEPGPTPAPTPTPPPSTNPNAATTPR
jgi:hypothetical protein